MKNQADANAIYRHNSYGPTFGAGNDFYLSNSCKSSTNSYCNQSSYITGNANLLGNKGQTNFQVSSYEVYHVIIEKDWKKYNKINYSKKYNLYQKCKKS